MVTETASWKALCTYVFSIGIHMKKNMNNIHNASNVEYNVYGE